MPEVTTCVRCQDRLERMGRHLAATAVEVEVGAEDE
jgi:RNA polymerase-binding transcription factor DksA